MILPPEVLSYQVKPAYVFVVTGKFSVILTGAPGTIGVKTVAPVPASE